MVVERERRREDSAWPSRATAERRDRQEWRNRTPSLTLVIVLDLMFAFDSCSNRERGANK